MQMAVGASKRMMLVWVQMSKHLTLFWKPILLLVSQPEKKHNKKNYWQIMFLKSFDIKFAWAAYLALAALFRTGSA